MWASRLVACLMALLSSFSRRLCAASASFFCLLVRCLFFSALPSASRFLFTDLADVAVRVWWAPDESLDGGFDKLETEAFSAGSTATSSLGFPAGVQVVVPDEVFVCVGFLT